jgi:hypothetical protein
VRGSREDHDHGQARRGDRGEDGITEVGRDLVAGDRFEVNFRFAVT